MEGVGIAGQLGLKVLTSWVTAWATADVFKSFLSESLTANYDRIDDDSLEGYGGRGPSYQGNQVLTGDTEHNWDYAADVFIPACMGIHTGTVLTIGEVLSEAACTANKYFGLELLKGGARNHRFFGAMITKFVLSGEKGGLVKLTCSWAAQQSSSIAAAAMTAPTAVNRVKFDQMTFVIGDQVDALAGGDVMGIESFEVSFDRSMKLDDYTSGQQPLEPKENAFRATTLKIKLPRYAADTLQVWRDADTPLQAHLSWTGPGTSTKLIEMPELRITEGFDANVGGAEVLTLEGTFEAFRGGTAFMYVGNEMKITYAL